MSKKLTRHPVSHVDAVWIGRDSPTNLMIINGVMLFDEVIDYDYLRDICEFRFVALHDRLRQRIVRDGDDQFWETDPHFDIRSHIRHIALPAPGDTAALQRLVSELMSASMDPGKPLWRFYLIENVNGGCAIFGRIHHGIGDGIALIRVLLSMADTEPDAPRPTAPLAEATKHRRSRLLAPAAHLLRNATHTTASVGRSLLYAGKQTITHPTEAWDAILTAGILGAASATILAKLLVLPVDRRSVFSGELGVAKRVVWSRQLDLEEVKSVGHVFDVTINDVAIAAVSGALRRYMLAHDDTFDAGDLRAMVPVNLRPIDAKPTLGNEFGLVYLTMPVGIADPQQRIFEVHRRMDLLKQSLEPFLVYQVLNVLGMMPGTLAREAADWFAGKATSVLTNVPGPRQTLFFAGKAMQRIIFWVPQSGDIGLGISIISYDGAIGLGIAVDEQLVKDPEAIIAAFHHEYEALVALARARKDAAVSEGQVAIHAGVTAQHDEPE